MTLRHLRARALCAVVGAAFMALTAAPLITAVPADAAPSGTRPAASTRFPEPAQFVSVSVDSVSPSTVTTSSPGTVTVAGVLRNVGDRPVRDMMLRLQRGTRVGSGAQLRTSLTRDPAEYETSTPFVRVAARLDPGQRTGFRVSVPLTGDDGRDGLGVDAPGVYPLLVNLNGTPDYGSQARLDDSRTLLSVLGLPADRGRARDADVSGAEGLDAGTDPGVPIPGTDGSLAPSTAQPAGLTMLWPLAATGQLAPGITGGGNEPVRLVSDDLAVSTRPGGRLWGLLDAIDSATGDTGALVTQSTCLAVDPDLLITVSAMARGYVVSTDPADPASATKPGTGAESAAAWLARLRSVAARMCVTALPFGQVDLDTLARAADPSLTRTGVRSPAGIVESVLGVTTERGVTIPTSGTMTPAAATMLGGVGADRTLLAASALTPRATSPDGQYRTGALAVQSYDPAVTTALSAMGAAPATPALTPASQRFDLSGESRLSRRLAGTAAMTYAALAPTTDADTARIGGRSDDPATGRNDVVVPPAVWSADHDDAVAVLNTANTLLQSGLAYPRPLAAVARDLTAARAPAELRTPPGTTADLIPLDQDTTGRIGRTAQLLFGLEASMVARNDVAMTAPTFVAPLAEDLVRAMRAAPVDTDAQRARTIAAARARVGAVDRTLDRMRGSVRVLDPGGRYTLASERSPLLLVIRNDLPISMRVRLDTTAPADLDVGDVGVVEVPPRGTRQIQLPTQAKSSASMTVRIALVSSSDVGLGAPIDLSVHSNAYGKPLFVVTICAAGLLVLLAGRRLWHRFRGQPDPADLDRPEPDERDRLMADSRYLHRPENETERAGR